MRALLGSFRGSAIARKYAPDGTGPFPAGLDEQLAALNAAGYRNVDCFGKDARLALFGGYA